MRFHERTKRSMECPQRLEGSARRGLLRKTMQGLVDKPTTEGNQKNLVHISKTITRKSSHQCRKVEPLAEEMRRRNHATNCKDPHSSRAACIARNSPISRHSGVCVAMTVLDEMPHRGYAKPTRRAYAPGLWIPACRLPDGRQASHLRIDSESCFQGCPSALEPVLKIDSSRLKSLAQRILLGSRPRHECRGYVIGFHTKSEVVGFSVQAHAFSREYQLAQPPTMNNDVMRYHRNNTNRLVSVRSPLVKVYVYTPLGKLPASQLTLCSPGDIGSLTSVAIACPSRLKIVRVATVCPLAFDEAGMWNLIVVVGLNGFGKFWYNRNSDGVCSATEVVMLTCTGSVKCCVLSRSTCRKR